MNELTYPWDSHPPHGTTREVAPGVHWLTMPMGGSLTHINLYMLEDHDGWYVVDQESTNGTYVGGRRVQGEVRVEGAPDLRFGGIKMTFRPVAVTQDAGAGTRAIAAVNVDALKKQAASAQSAKSAAASAAAAKALAQVPEEKKKGCAAVILLLVSLVGTGVGLLSLLLLAGR